MADVDLFDCLLNLEDEFYEDGYKLGLSDGADAGRFEGRLLGLEGGFQKFFEAGKLHGRSAIWTARLQGVREQRSSRQKPGPQQQDKSDSTQATASENPLEWTKPLSRNKLPPLKANPRLEKHIQTLDALINPSRLSLDNTEQAGTIQEDIFKRAVTKAILIEKIIKEPNEDFEELDFTPEKTPGQHGANANASGDDSIEDTGRLKIRY
ncbi:MAG: hypothetical protein M1834_002020 [Cirrosporium novae-zelandiae]|nr:MAG: hypothetical protein M1834_002020 [Cirrosporium novae-zelandiae]